MQATIQYLADLVNVCNATYYNSAAQRAPLLPDGAKELAWLAAPNEARALLVNLNGQTILSHQGTDIGLSVRGILGNLGDFLANFKPDPVTSPKGYLVAQGYLHMWAGIDPLVVKWLEAGNKIDVVIGHSEGASVAQLDVLESSWYTGQPVYAFTPPKTMEQAGIDAISKYVTRFLNKQDFAVAWPDMVLFDEYVVPFASYLKQTTNFLWVNESNQLVAKTIKDEMPAPNSWPDHVIPAWVSAFDAMAEAANASA